MKTIEREVMTRQEALERYPNLSRANLFGADLSGAGLSRTYLSKADLSKADLSKADLSGANLFGANLFGANLAGADLSRANLSGADLFGANLSEADLSGAKGIIRISGTRHEVLSTTKGIWVGCMTFDFKTWKDEFKQAGMDNNYTQDQIKEYKEYLELCTRRLRGADLFGANKESNDKPNQR